MTKIEEVARAICVADRCDWAVLTGPSKGLYRSWTRAAIEAMRVPNAAMDDAGLRAGPDRSHEDYWTAMIDAALAEKPNPS